MGLQKKPKEAKYGSTVRIATDVLEAIDEARVNPLSIPMGNEVEITVHATRAQYVDAALRKYLNLEPPH